MKTASWPGIVLALSAAVLWGTTGTPSISPAARVSPYWIGALRLAIAGRVLRAAGGGHRARRAPRGPRCRACGAGSCWPAPASPSTTSRSSPACGWPASRWARRSRSAAGRCSPARCRRSSRAGAPVPLWWLGTALADRAAARPSRWAAAASRAPTSRGLAAVPGCGPLVRGLHADGQVAVHARVARARQPVGVRHGGR